MTMMLSAVRKIESEGREGEKGGGGTNNKNQTRNTW